MNIYLLSESSHEGVINLPLIKANYFDVSLDISSYEALIFSSKNAVYALDKIDKNWRNIPAFAIGEATASVITKLGGNLAYVASNAYGNDFAYEIIEKLKGKKVAFLRAKKVLSNLEEILQFAKIQLDSHVLYETTCNAQNTLYPIEKNSIIIFTSPSTVECFFKSYTWDNSSHAVCIGSVTSKALPMYIKNLHVSSKQTIKGCIELAKTLIKQN